MFFQRIYDKSLAQASYMVGCQATKEAIVIDPKRDVDTYIEIAKNNNLNITHVTETHIHADFLSGTRELAAITGASIYLSDEGGEDWQYEFEHFGLKNGDFIKVGNVSLEVIHTPGHTPESISFLLTDHPATNEPIMIFTGDFVFVGDVGRPDLLEKAAGISGTSNTGAVQLYNSLKKFHNLPDYIQVWPGHGAGSACGKALGAVPSSTIGYEKIQNWALKFLDDKNEFVENLLEDQPEPPKYFAMMKKLNKIDRPLITEVPKPNFLGKQDFDEAVQKGIKIIDTRSNAETAEGFFEGSYCIQGNNSFATWMGWLINYDEPFVLIAHKDQVEDLTRKLMRIGLDNIYGFVTDFENIVEKNTLEHIIGGQQMKEYLHNDAVQIIDVRGKSEFESGHIPGAENLFVGTLVDNLDKIDTNKKTIIYCQSGARTSIAHSILIANGFHNTESFTGGMEEWNKIKNLETETEKQTITI